MTQFSDPHLELCHLYYIHTKNYYLIVSTFKDIKREQKTEQKTKLHFP